jgi:hypothetical protein
MVDDTSAARPAGAERGVRTKNSLHAVSSPDHGYELSGRDPPRQPGEVFMIVPRSDGHAPHSCTRSSRQRPRPCATIGQHHRGSAASGPEPCGRISGSYNNAVVASRTPHPLGLSTTVVIHVNGPEILALIECGLTGDRIDGCPTAACDLERC